MIFAVALKQENKNLFQKVKQTKIFFSLDSRVMQLPNRRTASQGTIMKLFWRDNSITQPGTNLSDIMCRLSWPGLKTVTSQQQFDKRWIRLWYFKKNLIGKKILIFEISFLMIYLILKGNSDYNFDNRSKSNQTSVHVISLKYPDGYSSHLIEAKGLPKSWK